jgi:tetraacyldisaccharide 4'-kinase
MLSPQNTIDILSGRKRGFTAAVVRGALSLAEPVYETYARRRNRRFDTGRLPIATVAAPVISVGNLTVGGTGKTPLVCWLAQWFLSRGIGVTLISRGYGRGGNVINDEARELAARLPEVPHLQNPDRVTAAQQALRANPRQLLILDDAFQHRRLARDLDIVLLDALEPFGYGRMLPRGLLREPLTGLSRAHVVGLSRADAVTPSRREEIRNQVAGLAPQAAWIELCHEPAALIDNAGQRLPLEAWSGKPVRAFCGIGNPAGFAHTLAAAGLVVRGLREFPDHHRYAERDLVALAEWTATDSEVQAVVCTHKDLVKIPRRDIGSLPLMALTVEMRISSGLPELQSYLEELSARVPI